MAGPAAQLLRKRANEPLALPPWCPNDPAPLRHRPAPPPLL